MDVKNYEELISSVSQEIAEKFLSLEENIPQRALFIDADITEITRLIGLETTQHVYEKVLKQQVDQKKRRVRDQTESDDPISRDFWGDGTVPSLSVEERAAFEAPE